MLARVCVLFSASATSTCVIGSLPFSSWAVCTFNKNTNEIKHIRVSLHVVGKKFHLTHAHTKNDHAHEFGSHFGRGRIIKYLLWKFAKRSRTDTGSANNFSVLIFRLLPLSFCNPPFSSPLFGQYVNGYVAHKINCIGFYR